MKCQYTAIISALSRCRHVNSSADVPSSSIHKSLPEDPLGILRKQLAATVSVLPPHHGSSVPHVIGGAVDPRDSAHSSSPGQTLSLRLRTQGFQGFLGCRHCTLSLKLLHCCRQIASVLSSWSLRLLLLPTSGTLPSNSSCFTVCFTFSITFP